MFANPNTTVMTVGTAKSPVPVETKTSKVLAFSADSVASCQVRVALDEAVRQK
jgi:hypothetical protein